MGRQPRSRAKSRTVIIDDPVGPRRYPSLFRRTLQLDPEFDCYIDPATSNQTLDGKLDDIVARAINALIDSKLPISVRFWELALQAESELAESDDSGENEDNTDSEGHEVNELYLLILQEHVLPLPLTRQWYAASVLVAVDHLRDWMTHASAEAVTSLAMSLQRLTDEWEFREKFEYSAVVGAEQLRKRYRVSPDIKNQYQEAVDEKNKRTPGLSHTRICREVCGQFDVSYKTIQRHTSLKGRGV